MGQHQARTTKEWGIGREEQDELAAASHHHLAEAWDKGFFDDLVTPYQGVTKDALLRPDTSVEKLAGLKPAFGGPDGTMTAGNSTALSDGAASVLLGQCGVGQEEPSARAGPRGRRGGGRGGSSQRR